MRKTTMAMRAQLRLAVVELRARMQWGQADLAREINKYDRKATAGKTLHREIVARWEAGNDAPSPNRRMALAKIAGKYRHEDLADIFRAPVIAWRLVARLKCNATDQMWNNM